MNPEKLKIEPAAEGFSPPAAEQEPVREAPEVKREAAKEAPPPPPETAPPPQAAPSVVKPSGHGTVSHDKLLTGIERILEENLEGAYEGLPPDVARAFKEKGEETAVTVRDLVSRTRVKVRAIVKLIASWLKMLPGVNRFFLVQEAKLKTDKILELKNRLQKKDSQEV